MIILDLFEVGYKEVEYAIKTLKYLDQSLQKTLILVSSIKTWALSGKKVKNPEIEEEEEILDDGEPDEGNDSVAEEEEVQGEEEAQKDPEGDEEEAVKIEYTSFKESDFEKRKTYPCYRNIKTLESLCISAGKSNPNLKTFILCPGVLYGNGEETLFPYFKQAWLQEPSHLTIFGDGKNEIPTIHYDDFAMHAKYLIYKPPRRIKYVVAIDYTKNR